MNMKNEVNELKKELEKIKKDGVFMEDGEIPIATEVIKMMKKNITRLYVILIIFIVLLIFSILDSIYQREQIIDILNDMEIVEETVTETIDVTQDGGDNSNNNFVNGDNNEVNNGSTN